MRYRTFFQLEIVHPYFSDGPADLVLVPRKQTSALLKGQHLLIKQTAKGLKVLIPVDETGNALPAIGPADLFTFDAFPTSGMLHAFTDTSAVVGQGNVLLFTNENLNPGNLELATSETAGEGQFSGFPAIATIQIKASEVNAAPVYRAIFQPRSIKWRYYFVANAGTTNLTVEDRDSQLTFNNLTIQNNTSDQVANSLQLNYAQAQVVAFESGTPIACSKQAIKNIQLLRDGHVVIKHLPNPEASDNGIQIIKIT